MIEVFGRLVKNRAIASHVEVAPPPSQAARRGTLAIWAFPEASIVTGPGTERWYLRSFRHRPPLFAYVRRTAMVRSVVVGASVVHWIETEPRGDRDCHQSLVCADLPHLRDGRRVVVPGIMLVRQKPGSAKGVMFITVEDETGVANLVLWPDRYAAQRRLVLSASMLACHGKVQREGEVVHLVADRLEDLSELLRGVGGRDLAAADCPYPERGIAARPEDGTTRELVPRPGHDVGIRVPTRDFR